MARLRMVLLPALELWKNVLRRTHFPSALYAPGRSCFPNWESRSKSK
jgi:hypothetical protein